MIQKRFPTHQQLLWWLITNHKEFLNTLLQPFHHCVKLKVNLNMGHLWWILSHLQNILSTDKWQPYLNKHHQKQFITSGGFLLHFSHSSPKTLCTHIVPLLYPLRLRQRPKTCPNLNSCCAVLVWWRDKQFNPGMWRPLLYAYSSSLLF